MAKNAWPLAASFSVWPVWFEAQFECRELVWRAFDADDTLLDEGRILTSFAEGC